MIDVFLDKFMSLLFKEIEQLSNYNMVDNYPKTPRDVVKLHNRYFKLFYGKPLTDDELVEEMTKRGYKVARRTIAKYRDQLSIPKARLRKEL